MLTPQQRQLVVAVIAALHDAVKVAGKEGAPAGILYAAVQQHGMRLDQFEQVMGGLVRMGHVRRSNNCYFAVEETR